MAALALTLTVPSSPVLAGDHKGPYVSGGVGVSFLSDSDTTVFDANNDSFDAVVEFDPGYAL